MGRPLYSRTFTTSPAVRDPEPPSCEKWSYLNAFDPDSDEFFDNENAVYEDFIDPVAPLSQEETENDGREEEEEEEERDVLVVRMGNVSPIASESSGSEDEGPLVADSEDDVEEGEPEPDVRVRLATRHPQSQFTARVPFRSRTFRPSTGRNHSLSLPTPSAPIPVPTASRRSAAVDERAFSSSSTPNRQTFVAPFAMSPPPASTPRLYTWARNPSHSPSPSSGSPFTNQLARTSYTHLSPALIRIRDVTV